MEPHRIGLDFSKVLMEIHGVDSEGKSVVSKKATRNEIVVYLSRLRPCLVGLEECGNAHGLARQLRNIGHDVRLVAPQLVASYRVKFNAGLGNAEAICQALPARKGSALLSVFCRVRSLFLETPSASQKH